MRPFSVFFCLLATSSAFTFVRTPRSVPTIPLTVRSAILEANVDNTGNNLVVKEVLTKASQEGLLTKVAASGLLSKAARAGVSLSNVESLLAAAGKNPDVLVLVESASPELLPLLPTIISTVPSLLPILAALVQTPPTVLIGGAGASFAAAFVIATQSPLGDSVPAEAIQTLLAAVLGLVVPAASLVGAKVLGDVTK